MCPDEQEYLWKLTEVLGVCSELQDVLPDEWSDEAKAEAGRKIDLAMHMLQNPHRGFRVVEYSAENGTCKVLRISDAPPCVGRGNAPEDA